ncbi:hypothetical protein NIES4101_32050 [Calothrix sp. NIES-4101]|nr:hypothetical protein NIES4101_32050 [Calothrix sp. NIES-4101]
MSTKASTQILLSEPSDDLIVSEPWSIDAYADGLMDELFADVDRILDGRGNIPVQTIEPEFVRLQSVKIPNVGLRETDILPTQTAVKVNQVKKQHISPVVTEKTIPKTVIKQRRQPRRWLGKLLSLGATVGIAAASIIFIQNSGLLNRLTSQSFQQSLLTSEEVTTTTGTHTELGKLVDYTLGALDVIDRQSAKTNRQSQNPGLNTVAAVNQQPVAMAMASTSASGTLPPPLAANNATPAQGRSTTVVERIYIPVYQAPLPMRYAPPAIPGVRGTLPPIPGRNPLSGNQAKVATGKPALNYVGKNVNQANKRLNVFAAVRPTIPSLKPISLQNKPITLSQPKAPTITIAPFRAVPPKMPTATAVAPKQQQVAVAPMNTPAHTLEGLLELGDKSAALFKINGVTRRVEIGENIGTSGWTLVDVANGEAIVRRNGEVRSVYAGQNF